MKKKKMIGLLIVAVAILTGWHYSQSHEVQLSELALENVEALASCEVEGWMTGYYHVTLFGDCMWTCRKGGQNKCPI